MPHNIPEYVAQINTLLQDNDGIFVYRGQSNAKWLIESSATRRIKNTYPGIADLQDQYIEYHQDDLIDRARLLGFGSDGDRRLSDLELLAQLQHYNAATGLIDFTYDPLAALWFALTGGDNENDENDENDGKVFVLNINDPKYFRKVRYEQFENKPASFFLNTNIDPFWYWEPTPTRDADQRIIRQKSVFIFGGNEFRDEMVIGTVHINGYKKEALREQLNKTFGIREDSLFNDFGGFAATNTVKHKLEKKLDADELARRGNERQQQFRYQDAVDDYTRAIAIRLEKNRKGGEEIVSFVSYRWLANQYYSRANAYVGCKYYQEAIADYANAIDSYKKFVKPLNTSSSTPDPWYAELYFNKGTIHSSIQEHDKAIENYNKAIGILLPENEKANGPSTLSRTLSTFLYNRGNTYSTLQKYTAAIDNYKRAIDHGFGSHSCWLNLGNAQIRNGQLNDALDSYDKSLEISEKEAARRNATLTVRLLGIFGQDAQFDVEELDLPIGLLHNYEEQTANSLTLLFAGNDGGFNISSHNAERHQREELLLRFST